MKNISLLTAMIERCRTTIQNGVDVGSAPPMSLRKKHLISMCDRMLAHLDSWSAEKINRWIGFIQGAMIANRYMDLGGAKAMFDEAKNAFGEHDQDMLDHLDPDVEFDLEIGGQG